MRSIWVSTSHAASEPRKNTSRQNPGRTWTNTSHGRTRINTDTYIDCRGQKHMKRYVLVGIATLAAACGSSPSSPSGQPNTVVFSATLSAANETPPITNVDKDA